MLNFLFFIFGFRNTLLIFSLIIFINFSDLRIGFGSDRLFDLVILGKKKESELGVMNLECRRILGLIYVEL